MGYMYEPPSMLGKHKPNRSRINNKQTYEEYKEFLLKRLTAIDVESGEIISSRIYNIWSRRTKTTVQYDDFSTKIFELTLDELLERTISAQENEIPYSIELEYSRDENFRSFIQENYPNLAVTIDAQAKNNNRSETYSLFYQYFINVHLREPRSICIITDKQLVFQTTKLDIRDQDNIERFDKEHLSLKDEYENQTKTKAQEDEHVFIFGLPSYNEPGEAVNFPKSGLSYSQYMFLLDYVNAYEDVKKELNDISREELQKKYQKHIDDIKEELDRGLQSGFAVRELNADEVIIGKIRTKEEIKRQMNYDALNSRNLIDTINSYGEDSFYREMFNEIFPNSNNLEEISRQMRNLRIYGLSDLEYNTEAFSTDNGDFDFESFYKRYINDAYNIVQKRQNELKSSKSNYDAEIIAIDMYKKGQELKRHITEFKKKTQIINEEIETIQRENGSLLPNVYQKQNKIKIMIRSVIRYLKKRKVTEVEGRIGKLEASKKEIESKIKDYTKKYDNMHIQNEEQFEGMTNEELDNKTELLMKEIENCRAQLKEVQDLLKEIRKTGVIENSRDSQIVA